MNYHDNVTILVNSCDKYEEAWEPFFKLFNIQWPDCPYRIILNTESKTFSCDYLSIETIHTGEYKTWTERVKAVLKKIDTEFVLFLLEDFFLLSPVDTSSWNKILNTIKSNEKIGFVGFPTISAYQPQKHQKSLDEFLYLTKKRATYRVNVSLGLWRREFFLQMLFCNGDPWYFEGIAPRLSRYSEYLATCWNQKDCCIFNYETERKSGYGIFKGKWLPTNKNLFDSFGIQVDYNNLGVLSTEEIIAKTQNKEDSTNKHIKKIKRWCRHMKSRFKDFKRFFKLYPPFRKYCKSIKQEFFNN